jgi:hypothetical protein
MPKTKTETTPVPPEPEAVKRVESDVARVRGNAKNAAAQKYGLSGTNQTKGALAYSGVEDKKKKLGGE